MLIITTNPSSIIKYHVIQNNKQDSEIFITQTSKLSDVKNILLQAIFYKDNELVPCINIIDYSGSEVLLNDFIQDKNNKTYLIVNKVKNYLHLKEDSRVTFLNLPLDYYQYEINVLKGILPNNVWEYYWSEYCIKRFKASPTRCHNEALRLLILIKHKKDCNYFTKEDIDNIYNKTSNLSKEYLKNIFKDKGKDLLSLMSTNQKFLIFIKAIDKKSSVNRMIQIHKPQHLLTYSVFKESFFAGTLRLQDSVIILHHLINKDTVQSLKELKRLFKFI